MQHAHTNNYHQLLSKHVTTEENRFSCKLNPTSIISENFAGKLNPYGPLKTLNSTMVICQPTLPLSTNMVINTTTNQMILNANCLAYDTSSYLNQSFDSVIKCPFEGSSSVDSYSLCTIMSTSLSLSPILSPSAVPSIAPSMAPLVSIENVTYEDNHLMQSLRSKRTSLVEDI